MSFTEAELRQLALSDAAEDRRARRGRPLSRRRKNRRDPRMIAMRRMEIEDRRRMRSTWHALSDADKRWLIAGGWVTPLMNNILPSTPIKRTHT
jgi:hypothetical protein